MTKDIPFLDVGAAYRELKSEIDNAIAQVLSSGQYIAGPEVASFESEWAEYCDAQYCVGVANGTDALILALRACDIGPGDGVIVPSHTYIATWLAISAVGASIQPVEPDPKTYNITAEAIDDAITPSTRAILPVHMYGQPTEIDRIAHLAETYQLKLIEDAAQAHGARVNGHKIGSHSHATCWSFYPGKNLGALGDAGAVTTNDPEVAKQIRLLGNHGSKQKYVALIRGVNSRLDPVQAAALRVKLAYLDEWNNRRKRIAVTYNTQLHETGLSLPLMQEWSDSAWHQYVVRFADRDLLQERLARSGVNTLIHYPIPPHMQKAYSRHNYPPESLPVARSLSNELISLPIGPHLSDASIETITNKIIENVGR